VCETYVITNYTTKTTLWLSDAYNPPRTVFASLFAARMAQVEVEGKAGRLVLPGDVIVQVTSETKLKIGPGLRRDNDVVVASKAGVLQFKKPSTVWVDGTQKRVMGQDRHGP